MSGRSRGSEASRQHCSVRVKACWSWDDLPTLQRVVKGWWGRRVGGAGGTAPFLQVVRQTCIGMEVVGRGVSLLGSATLVDVLMGCCSQACHLHSRMKRKKRSECPGPKMDQTLPALRSLRE